MKFFIKIYFLLIFTFSVFGQKTQVVLKSFETDSSYYYIKKISQNEYWVGGEYGILNSLDTLGNIGSINFPNEGKSILRIKKTKDFVFILTANAYIYRYDIASKTFLKKEFEMLKDMCFYDLIELKNGQLLVCGGDSGIAKGRRKIPRGFMATMDQDFNNLKIVWRSFRKFVWSITESENNTISAASYNGINTQIIQTNDFTHWKKIMNIKGLVHELAFLDNQLWFCGSKNKKYMKDGMFGKVVKGQNRKVLSNTGCLWSMDFVNGNIISVTQSGEVIQMTEGAELIEKKLNIPKIYTLYDVEEISPLKYFIVGHGKIIYIVDFKK